MESHDQGNSFVDGALPTVFFKTALPIVIMMLVNGSFTLVDAYFLGEYVGAEALTAVTSVFPVFMLLVALSTLVSNGFASVMARLLGANEYEKGVEAYAQAITLSLIVCAILIVLFSLGGDALVMFVNNGSESLSQMSYIYIGLLIFFSPLNFILAINGDSLRSEGHVSFIALVSLCSVLFNGLFNYYLIVELQLGVAGSACGTVLAQAVSVLVIALFRRKQAGKLKVSVFMLSKERTHWSEFLALGAPSSLSYLGIALSSAAILFNLQIWSVSSYETTVGAYGIITRLMTFIFLPMLGISLAFQTIVGNNVGAKKLARANSSIKIALCFSLFYCVLLQSLMYVFKDSIGAVFVGDIGIQSEVARILPWTTLGLFLFGPMMILTMFFQAIGDAKRAGILGLAKIYLFALPLTFVLPYVFKEPGIWYSGPLAEFLALGLALLILYRRSTLEQHRFGLFFNT